MSEQGQDASFFTHRCVVATPDGFGPEASSSIDRYVVGQMCRRWSGAFARLENGVYLMRLDDESASDAYSLMVMLAVSLFGRISTPAVRLEALHEEMDSSGEPVAIDEASIDRLRRTLASFAQQESEHGTAPAAPATAVSADHAALGAIEGVVRDALERLEGVGGEVGALAGRISEIQDGVGQISERMSSLESAPRPETDGDDEAEKPLFNIAKSGAVTFATSLKSMSRQVETAVAALTDAVKRIDEAAPGSSIAAPEQAGSRVKEPSEETLRSLAENLAELARGQARIAATLESGGAQHGPQADGGAVSEEPQDGADPLNARVVKLTAQASSNQSAAETLASRVDALRSEAPAEIAELLAQMSDLAQENRAAANLMLDVAVAWSRSSQQEGGDASAADEAAACDDANDTPADDTPAEEAIETEVEASDEDVAEASVIEEAEDDAAEEEAVEEADAESDAPAEDEDSFGQALSSDDSDDVKESA